MIRFTTRGALAAAMLLSVGGCATRAIDVGPAVAGDGIATLARDGSIRMKVRTADGDGMSQDGVVVFRPGDPAYEALKAQVEAAWPAKRRPTLTWEIGTPVYEPAAP